MTNTAIYIDYDNVFITLERYYRKFDIIDIHRDFIKKLFDKFSSDNILHSRGYLNFGSIDLTKSLYEEFTKHMVQLYHVHSGNNTSDVQLIIDVIKSLYDPYVKIDKYIIVSSDSDMIPLINELKMNGKKFEIYYFDFNTNLDYKKYLQNTNNKFFAIEDLLGVNVYKRENEDKFEDLDFLNGILPYLNNLINEKYNQFLKRDANGHIISAGTLNKGALRDYLEGTPVFVREDLSKGFAIDTLYKKGIIYDYPVGSYKAILIAESLLNSKGITLTDLKRESDFSFPINV